MDRAPDRQSIWPDVVHVSAWLGVAIVGGYGLRAVSWLGVTVIQTLVMILGLGAGLGVIAGVSSASRKLSARRHSYWVEIAGETHLTYQERASNSEIRRLKFDCLRVPIGPRNIGGYEVRVPPETGWADGVPQWAQGRRAEILQRIVAEYGGGTQFRFVDGPRTPGSNQ